MGQKYQKPVARNLGEMLPNAEGFCISVGNSANVHPPSNNCNSGTSAVGGNCSHGDGATSLKVCQAGTNPYDYGCIDGTFADTPHGCMPGTSPSGG